MDINDYLVWGGVATDLLEQLSYATSVAFQREAMQGQSIVLTRGSFVQAAQIVIVAPVAGTQVTIRQGAANRTGTINLMLIGVRNHPTLASFDVQPGDRFSIGTAKYEVVFVDTGMAGKTEAHCWSIQ